MTSREKILAEIKQNKPAAVIVPQTDFDYLEGQDVLSKYKEILNGIGGNCFIADYDAVKTFLLERKAKGIEVVNGLQNIDGYNIEDYQLKNGLDVEGVDTVFIKGTLAVAENGSVWVTEKNMVNRMLPFICQHLVIVVDEKDVVANMHEAYKKLVIGEDDYGVFIAGPSKTADIEQSLVIGAHGPLSMNVFVIRSNTVSV